MTGRHDGWWHYYDNFALHSGVEKVDASFTRLHASFINAPFRDSIFDWGNVSQFTGAPRAFRPAAMSEADGVPDVTDPSDMSEEAAAVKIQAMQRGKQARREHEELKRVQTAFVAFDTDGSGSLEIAELYDVLKEVGVDIDKGTFADVKVTVSPSHPWHESWMKSACACAAVRSTAKPFVSDAHCFQMSGSPWPIVRRTTAGSSSPSAAVKQDSMFVSSFALAALRNSEQGLQANMYGNGFSSKSCTAAVASISSTFVEPKTSNMDSSVMKLSEMAACSFCNESTASCGKMSLA